MTCGDAASPQWHWHEPGALPAVNGGQSEASSLLLNCATKQLEMRLDLQLTDISFKLECLCLAVLSTSG
jgi:hypothetical protein